MSDGEHSTAETIRTAYFYSKPKKGPTTVQFRRCSDGQLLLNNVTDVPAQVKYQEQSDWYEFKAGDIAFFSRRGESEHDPQGPDELGLYYLDPAHLERAKDNYKKRRTREIKAAQIAAAQRAQAQAAAAQQARAQAAAAMMSSAGAGLAQDPPEPFTLQELVWLVISPTPSASRAESPHSMSVDEPALTEPVVEQPAPLAVDAAARPDPAEHLRLAEGCASVHGAFTGADTHARTAVTCTRSTHPQPTTWDKTTVHFNVPDEPGKLAAALTIFASQHLNLVHIQSGEHSSFYVELNGRVSDSNLMVAIDRLQGLAGFVKVLNSPLHRRSALV